MKKTLAILAGISLAFGLALADLIPRQDYTSDASKPPTRRNLTFRQAGSQKLGWTFKQKTTAKDLTTATLITFTYVDADQTWSQVVTGALDVATNGSVLVTFTPAQLNTNSTTAGLFDWLLEVTDGTLVMAYAYGKLNLLKDFTGGITNSFPTTSQTVNWADFAAYENTAASGPYRAGTAVSFSANADGSVDIDVTTGGDTTYTNYAAGDSEIVVTGAARSGSNTWSIASTIARDSEVVSATSGVFTASVLASTNFAKNASNISSGTVADARIASTITRDSELTTATNAVFISATNSAAAYTDSLDSGNIKKDGSVTWTGDDDHGGNAITNVSTISFVQAVTNHIQFYFNTVSNRWAYDDVFGATTNTIFVSPLR